MKLQTFIISILCIFVLSFDNIATSAAGADYFRTWVSYNSPVDHRYYYSNDVPKTSSSLYAEVYFTVRAPGSSDITVYLRNAVTKTRVTTIVSVPHTERSGNNGYTVVHPKYTSANSALGSNLQLVVETSDSTVTSITGSWSPISNYSPSYK